MEIMVLLAVGLGIWTGYVMGRDDERRRMGKLVVSLAARVVAQSELLSRKAEKAECKIPFVRGRGPVVTGRER